MTDRVKDAEIPVLRHQVTALERQLDTAGVRFTGPDRALLAALLYRSFPASLRRMRLLERPETVLQLSGISLNLDERDLAQGSIDSFDLLEVALLERRLEGLRVPKVSTSLHRRLLVLQM
ncbi:hypothetical protein [Actinomadura rugatobispora]|uniref:Uncharacterized protein n=1 Tax=Actinomadura rugatobispora TaxID=1994 RepID=A0ABW1A1U6_9ACTN|nr:hypothetical protein GCM10010200_084040 [Actinomadura rugatobispora]